MDIFESITNMDKLTLESYKRVYMWYMCYTNYYRIKIGIKMINYLTIPENQRLCLEKTISERIRQFDNAINCNQAFFNDVIKTIENFFKSYSDTNSAHIFRKCGSMNNILRQVFREWSSEGFYERNLTYKRIYDLFCTLYTPQERSNIKVLVPGSGLGRLAYDLATTGCNCTHNDFNVFVNTISHCFLNNLFENKRFTIYPWVTDMSNNYGGDRLLYSVHVPDISINKSIRVDAKYGDFITCFRGFEDHFDCIVTCFFIDTTPNIITVIETIHSLLKKGGIWINLGPLYYQSNCNVNRVYIEPTYEEIEHIIYNCLKFKEVKKMEYVKCPHFYNKENMKNYEFICAFFAVRK